MLEKKLRVNIDSEISYVLKKGKRVTTDELSLLYLPNRRNFSRFGFIVSKKVSNKTTQRNLVKRRMRYVAGNIRHKVAPGFDYILIARPKIKSLDFAKLQEKIIFLFQRVK